MRVEQGKRGALAGMAGALRRLRPSPLALKIAIIALVLDGFVLSLAGVSAYGNYRQHYIRAEIISRNLSAVLAETVRGYLDRMDFGLRVATDGAEREAKLVGGDQSIVDEALRKAHARVPEATAFWVAGADGVTRRGSQGVGALNDVDLSDRDYFRYLRDHPDAGMAISRPLVGRISGQWVMVLARRITTADGGFGGIAYASMPVRRLSEIFSSVDLGRDDGISMRGPLPDLGAIARFPETVGGRPAVGNPAVSSELRTMTEAYPDKGTYLARAGIDGIERVLSYHRVDGYPYYVVVGLATSRIRADWLRENVEVFALSLAFLGLTALGGHFALTSLRTRQALDAELRGALAVSQDLTAALAHRNDELGRFADILAHHMQEPVRQQHIFAQHLERLLPKPLAPDVQQSLAAIIDAARHHRALLRDAQKYLAVDRAAAPVRAANGDTALDAALEGLGARLAAAGAVVERVPLPVLAIGTSALAEIFTALIDNAVAYCRQDVPPHIRVSVEIAGEAAVVAVADNGIGIPAEFHEHVFGVFKRLNPRPDHPGTGIGLALARKIVEAAGGRIWIERPDEPGTRICFSLPLGT